MKRLFFVFSDTPSMMMGPFRGLLLAAVVAVVLLHPTTTQELSTPSNSLAASDLQGEPDSIGDDALLALDFDIDSSYDSILLEEDADVDEQTLLLQLADETAAANSDMSVLLELDTTGGAVVRHAANVLGGAHVVRQTARRASSWYTGDHLIPHEADGSRLDVAEAQRAAENRAAARHAAAAPSSAEHVGTAAKEAAPALRGNAAALPKAVAPAAAAHEGASGAATLQAAHHEAHLAFADAQAKAELAAEEGAGAEADADAKADVDADADADADAEAEEGEREGADADADAEGEQQHEHGHGQSAAGSGQWPSMSGVASAASNLFSKLKTFASDAASGGIGNALMNARSSLGIGQCPGRPVPCSGRGSCDMK